MIEELVEYFIRIGYDEDLADEIHTVFYHGRMDGIIEHFSKKWCIEEHDHIEEIIYDVKNWEKEVGED